MKFIHISDIHLGKRVNEFSMLEEQEAILGQILGIIDEEAPVNIPPTTGGEDFAYFMEKAPGCVLLLGVGDEASGACYPNHNSKFTVHEPELIKGAQIYAKLAMDFTSGKKVEF